MEKIIIKVAKRENHGTSVVKRIRTAGVTPAVIYSKTLGSISAEMNTKDFIQVASSSRSSQIFTLESEDAALNGKLAIVKEVQQDTRSGKVLHVDFQALEFGSAVKVNLPLKVKGEADGVKNQGGILAVSARYIVVSAIPEAIPAMLEVDVSHLKLGDRLKTAEIILPEGVQLKSNPAETVASVVSSRAATLQAETAATPAAGAAAPAATAAAAPAKAK